jgi:hypothetical protein
VTAMAVLSANCSRMGLLRIAGLLLLNALTTIALSSPDQEQQNARIFKAALENDPDEIKAAVDAGAQINFVVEARGGQGPLMAACLSGDILSDPST